MKILLTHRFFWPDTAPYALMLRSIGDHLAAAGHEVGIMSSAPSYRHSDIEVPRREKLGDLDVYRCWVLAHEKSNPLRRIANVMLYCGALFRHILRSRPDVVSASTFPPVIAAWTASLAAKIVGAKFIYHMQDIHPEVSTISGGRLGRGMPKRILRMLDNQTLRRSDAIVVLSDDMATTLHDRALGPLPIHVINNLSLDLFEKEVDPPAELRKRSGTRRVIFAGNLGQFQNLPVLAEGIAQVFKTHSDLELLFLGDGSALETLKARWADTPQVVFAPFLPFSQARVLIAEADVGLVSLTPDLYRVAYPSKILTYIDLGVQMLALVEPHSALARQLVENGYGAVPASSKPDDIANALVDLLDHPRSLKPHTILDPEATKAAWLTLFKKLRAT